MATTTFYFDGHNGITDADNVWTNESNVFDGDENTYATTAGTSGDYVTNILLGDGTTATGSGSITQIRARVRARSQGLSMHARVYEDGNTNLLGEAEVSNSVAIIWSSYVTLTPPSGGWTWQKAEDLVVRVFETEPSALSVARVFKVEIEVTHSDTSASIDNVQSISNVVSITL